MLGRGEKQVNVQHPQFLLRTCANSNPQAHCGLAMSIVVYRPYMVYTALLMPKLRTNIYLTDKQKALLERLSERTGAPVAELIRRAIDNYLTMRRKELK